MAELNDFSFCLPETNLVFGSKTLENLGERARLYGTKALLVTGNSAMRQHGFLKHAKTSLESAGLEVTLFEGVNPNPTITKVNQGVDLALKNNCEVVVAIGGGSTIDASKAIAIGLGHKDNNVWPYIVGKKKITQKTAPLIAIPSTSGTGSHVTWYTVITNPDTEEKAATSSKFIYPKESIVDLDIVSKMPAKVTAETGFDALAHAMESYLSNSANPLTDMLALHAIALISYNLPKAFGDGTNTDSRSSMALADTLAGISITFSRTIMVHGIGNTVSGLYPHISHGQALACLTPHVMKFNIENGDEQTISKYCDVARALGQKTTKTDIPNALKSVDGVINLLKTLGMDKSLSECGVKANTIERLADYSVELGRGALNSNPVKPTRKDIVFVYEQAL